MDMKEMGDIDGARALLMEELHDDLRYLDAHAHLGNIEFDLFPEKALAHYELAIRIGAMSLPADEDLLLPWGCITNRPYHRALSGYGQALWKLGQEEEAEAVFERMLALNPPDNLGIQELLFAVRDRVAWEEWAVE
ncbi:MAG: tetratricopeptide repeat protein [Sandaracinaceae bacterium]